MSWEDRYDAMLAEQDGQYQEGKEEVIRVATERLRSALVNKPYSNLKAEIMDVIDELEGMR